MNKDPMPPSLLPPAQPFSSPGSPPPPAGQPIATPNTPYGIPGVRKNLLRPCSGRRHERRKTQIVTDPARSPLPWTKRARA